MTKVCLLLDDSREHVDGSASSDCDLESAESMVTALWKEIYADEAGCAPTKKGSTISRGSARISMLYQHMVLLRIYGLCSDTLHFSAACTV